MKKVALLGGSRFIGYHSGWALYRHGYEITLFNRGRTVPPGPFPTNMKSVLGDRNRADDLRNLFYKDFDFVIDLSGYTVDHVEPIIRNYRDSIGHYIFCSTSSVYKIPPPCPFHEGSPRTFAAKTYGGDKALVEELLLRQHTEYKWPVTIFRPQGVFGAYDAHQAWFVFSRLLHSTPISVRSGNNSRINFLYVDDFVKAFLLAMSNAITHGEVYGVAGDEIISQIEFIELCGKVSSRKPLLHFVDNPNYDDIKVGVPWLEYDLVADNRKIKKELGLSFTPLGEALAETLRWILRNPKHLGVDWFRGERYILWGRQIPKWVKIRWRLVDWALRAIRRFAAR